LQECRAVAVDEIRISETCFGLEGGSQNSSMLYEQVYSVIDLTILLSILSCCMSINYLEKLLLRNFLWYRSFILLHSFQSKNNTVSNFSYAIKYFFGKILHILSTNSSLNV
jgi:hypothetical protein